MGTKFLRRLLTGAMLTTGVPALAQQANDQYSETPGIVAPGGVLTVTELKWNKRWCLVDGDGLFTPSFLCLGKNGGQYNAEKQVSVFGCTLVERNGYLSLKLNGEQKQTIGELRLGQASQLSTDEFKNQTSSETRTQFNTGVTLSFGGWMGGDIVFVWSRADKRVTVQVNKEIGITQVNLYRVARPTLAPILETTLDRVSCHL